MKKTILFGLLSAGMYTALFSHSMEVATLCALGGPYAICPIAIVFLFSLVHGTFASNVWSSLGIKARTTKKAVRKAVRQRPRLQLRAY